ncbi:mitochondrial proton/calcium exchanger protein-like protein isoform X1 [Tanacetum coccineum]
MSKTRADYGSGVARPKIEDKDNFELKGQFLKELRSNTFSGSDHEDVNEHIEKVLEIVDLFHTLNITIDQVMLRAFPMSLTGAEVILFYNGLERLDKFLIQEVPYHLRLLLILAAIQAQLNNLGREIKKVNEKVYAAQVGCEQCKGGGYRATAPRFYQRNNTNPSYQEQRQSMEETLSKFMRESVKRHEENSNLIKEIRASTDATIRNQGASIKTLEIQIGQMSKLMQARYAILDHPNTPASHINNSIPRKEKDPGSFTLPCYINNVCFDNALADLGASVSIMPLSTYLNLGLGELAHTKLTVELADRTVKYPKGIAENVLVGIGKFIFPIDFIILDMPKDIKVPLILERPFLSTAHAMIDVFKKKITLRVGEEKIFFKSVKPARENLVLNRSLDPLCGDYIELNDLNIPLELRRDQVDDLMPTIEEGEVIEEFRARNNELDIGIDDYPSFCDHDKKIRIDCAHNLKFSCMIDFAVLEDMDAYHDEGIGDVIFSEPFFREVGIKARRFDGMITIYNGNESVSKEDKMNGILHSYQKLKRFYKGVLNLGPEYIQDPSMEEWLTRGHVSVHEME